MTQRKLAIFLGPYRNLSTLTAAVLSLHPEIQVLNHAAVRFWAKGSDLDFVEHPDMATLDRFMDAAWELSAGGERGTRGGSILHSHAYDDDGLKDLYRERYGEMTVKPDAKWLVWKESMLVQNRLMAVPGTFERLCRAFPDLRFILPMRRPLDCAVSNRAKGHAPTLGLPAHASVETVFGAVLEAFAWALDKRDQAPERIAAFTQAEAPRAIFSRLATFLGLAAPEQWLADAERAFVLREGYKYTPETLAFSAAEVGRKLARWPELASILA